MPTAPPEPPTFRRLDAQDLAAWLAAHPQALLLDAREARHHEQGHLAGSLRLDGRNHEALLLREDRQRPVFIYCYHGNASRSYAQMFVDFGFRQVFDLIGGWDAWLKRTDRHGNTPLMEAAWRGQTSAVQALIAQGVDLAAVNADGNNALWLGCVSNDPELVSLLARAGVPIDHQNLAGATCLMYAASSGKAPIVRRLLELGADPQRLSQDDYSALDMAATLECLQLLRAATRRPTTPRTEVPHAHL